MKGLPVVRTAFVLALIGAETYAQIPPPGGREPIKEPLYAIALEAGALRALPEVTEEELFAFDAGAVFLYLGEATDTFGREWEMVGDPETWSRRQQWYVVAASAEELRDRVGPVTLVEGISPPAIRPEPVIEDPELEVAEVSLLELSPLDLYSASLRQPVTVG